MRELVDEWTGGLRLTLWLTNPNDTAAFLALCICLFSVLMLVRSRWIVACACVGIFAGASLLGLTGSRGGVLALLAGLFCAIAMCAWQRRWLPCAKLGAIGLIVLIFAFLPDSTLRDRTAKMAGGDDGSTEARLLIYKHVTSMLVAGPGGWGWGRGADAYMQWFQPVSDLRAYLNLTSTHFTWMVEGGILFSIVYLVAWHGVLGLAWLMCWRGSPAPRTYAPAILAGLVCSYLLGFFNHCGDNWEFWIPCALIVILLLHSAFFDAELMKTQGRFLSLGFVSVAICSTALLLATLFITHQRMTGPTIQMRNGLVWVGEGDLAGVAAFPDPNIVGKHYGKEVRRQIQTLSATGDHRRVALVWTQTTADLRQYSRVPLIMTGHAPSTRSGSFKTTYWLNPPPFEQINPEMVESFLNAENCRILWGVMRRDASPAPWEPLRADHSNLQLIPLFGTGQFAQAAFAEALTDTLGF